MGWRSAGRTRAGASTARCLAGRGRRSSGRTRSGCLPDSGSRGSAKNSTRLAESLKCAWRESLRRWTTADRLGRRSDPADFCKTVHEHLSSAFPDRFTTLFGKATALSSPASTLTRTASAVLPAAIALSAKRHLTFVSHESNATPVELPFDHLLIAAGPWSAAVCEQLSLPSIPLTNLPGHSLLIRPALSLFTPSSNSSSSDLPSEAVFAGISGAVGGVHASTSGLARGLTDQEKREGYTRSPELFVRANGLIYVAGENSIPEKGGPQRREGLPNKLPDTVDGVKNLLDERCVGRLKRAAGAVSPLLKEENGALIEKQQVRSTFRYCPELA